MDWSYNGPPFGGKEEEEEDISCTDLCDPAGLWKLLLYKERYLSLQRFATFLCDCCNPEWAILLRFSKVLCFFCWCNCFKMVKIATFGKTTGIAKPSRNCFAQSLVVRFVGVFVVHTFKGLFDFHFG